MRIATIQRSWLRSARRAAAARGFPFPARFFAEPGKAVPTFSAAVHPLFGGVEIVY